MVCLGSVLRCYCIAFCGDVDTVESIVLCAASCSAEVAQDLPTVLYDGLEDGTYGRHYLLALEARLRARFPLTDNVF